MPHSTAACLSLLLIAVLVEPASYAQGSSPGASGSSGSLTAQQVTDATVEAQTRIDDAIPIVGKMKSDPHVNELLQKCKGIVIVPHYLQAALVFGGRAGSGVFLARRQASWSDPVFYKISGGSFGAQIGGTKGALVLMLMSDKAVNAFENQASTWSLSAGAGLTAVNYSKQTPESETLSDVIVWSDTKGLFGGAAVGASKVTRDASADQIYYKNSDVTAQQILSGAITNPNASSLVAVMPRSP